MQHVASFSLIASFGGKADSNWVGLKCLLLAKSRHYRLFENLNIRFFLRFIPVV